MSQELTGRRRSRSVGSGTSLMARIDDEELGCPRLKTRLVRPLQGCRRCVAQRRGRGRHGGASGRVGEARGRQWPRWWRSAATGSLGWLRRERWGEEGGTRERGEMQGCRGALGALQQQRRQAGGGRARAGVWRPRAPAYWREVGDDWHLQWAGLLQ